jgi:hypothetical protein
MKCCLIQIHGSTPRESSNAMTSLPQNRLMFTLKSGSPSTLKKHNVLRAFPRFVFYWDPCQGLQACKCPEEGKHALPRVTCQQVP